MVRQAQGTGDVYVEDAPLGSNGMGSDQYNYQDNCDYPYPSDRRADSSYFDSTMKPAWVDDLLGKLEQVNEKLNEIKDAVSFRNLDSSKNFVDNDSDTKGHTKITDYLEKVVRVPELVEYETYVKQKVKAFYYDKEVSGASTSGTLGGSIRALLMYITKLVEQPTVPRYRRVSTTNQTYKTLIAPLKGHDEFLKAVGFSKKGMCFEWTDTSPVISCNGEKEMKGREREIPT